LMAEGHKQEASTLQSGAQSFTDRFKQEHNIEISFDESGLERLMERARKEHMGTPELCAHLFKDYQFGLNLIQKNSGQQHFVLNAAAVDDPDKFLSELVVKSYYPAMSPPNQVQQ